MAIDATIGGRLEAVEEAIEELRREVEDRSVAPNRLERMAGIFKNEPAFDEVIRLGREFRAADRPAEHVGCVE